jgi:hypothetical protein
MALLDDIGGATQSAPQASLLSDIGYSEPKPVPAPENTWSGAIKGSLDAALSLGTHALAGTAGALARTANRIIPDYDGNREIVKQHIDTLQNALSYDPKSPEGQYAVNQIAKIIEPAADNISDLVGGYIGKENVPAAADLAAAIPGPDMLTGAAKAIKSIPEAVSGTVSGTRALMSGTGFDISENIAPKDIGLHPVSDLNPTGLKLAGSSAAPTLKMHHQALGNTIAGAEAGLPAPETTLDPGSLARARIAPNSVMTRVGQNTPTGAVEPSVLDQIDSAGPTGAISGKGSIENIQSMKDNLKGILSNPDITGPEKMNWLQELRTNGYKNIASKDPGTSALGKTQLDSAKALENHIETNLPSDADVSIDQFRDARIALAKNHTVESALKGNTMDLRTLARIYTKSPNLMTDGLGMLGKFAAENPEVVGPVSRLKVPSVGQDIFGLNLERPVQTGVQAVGGSAGRKLLVGDTGQAIQNAWNTFSRGQSRFKPLDTTPQPPPGMTASTPPVVPPKPQEGRGGGISYADLLSHGLEKEPEKGLSLAPMEAPQSNGIPFTRNAEHEAGELSLADENSWFKEHNSNNQDYAAVKSQGVPEGVMARTSPTRARGTSPSIDYPSGAQHDTFSLLEDNASRGGAGSNEAISRLAEEKSKGTKPVIINPDGMEQTLLHDVTAVDRNPPKGHIIADASTGKLINSGGMSQKEAQSLLNRWRYFSNFKKTTE